MANTGVSPSFKLNGVDNFKITIKDKMVQLDLSGLQAKPPTLTGKYEQDIVAIEKFICTYPDIAFEKIILPQFDGIGRYTGNFSNQPDFIKDYHVISLMRMIDQISKPSYKAQITAKATTPQFATPDRGK